MSAKPVSAIFEQWLQGRVLEQLSDATLLERYLIHRDELAFAAILRRHGGMVQGVIAKLVDDPHDQDDAFQATFLVMVKKASAIRKKESLAAWLHGVARRIALHSRRQRRPFAPLTVEPHAPPAAARTEAADQLDVEIDRLPEQFRQPVVLCYLEGHTLDQAALQLGWPKGSVAGRLARAKEMLRTRLLRQGVSAAAVAVALDSAGELTAVPAALLQQTLAVVLPGATVRPGASSLAQGVLAAMFWKRLSLVALFAVGLSSLSAGGFWLTLSSFAQSPGAKPSAVGPPPAAPRRPASVEAATNETSWWLILLNGRERKALRADGKETLPLLPDTSLRYDQGYIGQFHMSLPKDMPINGAFAPDGSQLVFVGDIVNGKAQCHPFHGYLILAKPDGADPVKLTGAKLPCRDISWSPDGKRIAYCTESGKRIPMPNQAPGYPPDNTELLQRVEVMDVASGKVLYRFGGETEAIHEPQFTPRGRLSYLVLRGRNGKSTLNDLVVRILDGTMSPDALRPVTLVEKQDVLGWAFNADESKLAYSLGTEIVVKNLNERGYQTWTSEQVGKKHGFDWFMCFVHPVWRPDGQAVACKLVFRGGRQEGDQTPVPGENKIVIFPLGKEAEAVDVAREWRLVRWASGTDIAKEAPKGSHN